MTSDENLPASCDGTTKPMLHISEATPTWNDIAKRAALFIIDDWHTKWPTIAAAVVMGYGYIFAPTLLDNCKALAAWLLVFATGAGAGVASKSPR